MFNKLKVDQNSRIWELSGGTQRRTLLREREEIKILYTSLPRVGIEPTTFHKFVPLRPDLPNIYIYVGTYIFV